MITLYGYTSNSTDTICLVIFKAIYIKRILDYLTIH